MDLRTRGVHVTIRTTDGKSIVGWLLSETHRGTFVSLDKKGEDIRFISEESLDLITYEHDDMAAFAISNPEELDKQIRDLNAAVRPLKSALKSLDIELLNKVVSRAKTIQRDAEHAEHDVEFRLEREWYSQVGDSITSSRLLEYRHARVGEAIDIFRELHHELDKTDILNILAENEHLIRRLPIEFSLPDADLPIIRRGERGSIEPSDLTDRSVAGINDLLRRTDDLRVVFIVRNSLESPPEGDKSKDESPAEAAALKELPPPDRGRFVRWAAASVRILGGSALTAANGLLGISAGFTASLATIGMTTVPVAVGVAVSMHTGISQVADGLEKVGTLLKEGSAKPPASAKQ